MGLWTRLCGLLRRLLARMISIIRYAAKGSDRLINAVSVHCEAERF